MSLTFTKTLTHRTTFTKPWESQREGNELEQRHQTYKKMARNGQTGMMVGEEMSEVTPAVTCSTPSFAFPDAITTETPPNAAFHAASSCSNTQTMSTSLAEVWHPSHHDGSQNKPDECGTNVRKLVGGVS